MGSGRTDNLAPTLENCPRQQMKNPLYAKKQPSRKLLQVKAMGEQKVARSRPLKPTKKKPVPSVRIHGRLRGAVCRV